MKIPDQKTIGILYPGEMGSNLGRLLSAAGFNVITTTIDRSARTQSLCHDAGLIPLKSMKDVVEQADVIVSVVSPDAALSLAEEIALLAKGRAENLLYVDANSISPLTVFQISECLSRAGIDLVDASIMGPASQLEKRGMLYLS